MAPFMVIRYLSTTRNIRAGLRAFSHQAAVVRELVSGVPPMASTGQQGHAHTTAALMTASRAGWITPQPVRSTAVFTCHGTILPSVNLFLSRFLMTEV